jgi:hypothetical protein
MTNGELSAILQRFPAEGEIKVRRASDKEATAIDRAEMAIDPSPMTLQAQNISWAELVKEKVGVVLVFGEPQVSRATAALTAANK